MGFFGSHRNTKQEPQAAPAPRPAGPQMVRRPSTLQRSEDTSYYEVVCPYCMNHYPVWELQFRSKSVLEEGETSGKGYPREEDKLYAKFWENMHMPAMQVELAHVLSVNNPNDVQAVELWSDDPLYAGSQGPSWIAVDTPERYKRIQKRAIRRVKDKFGGISSQRICPKCHNNLPDVIGLYPNYIVSLMGNTSCGKTVYLSRLLNCLFSGELLPGLDQVITCQSESTLGLKKRVKKMFEKDPNTGEQVLASANPITYIEPIILDIQRERQHILLTLFDFPGEAIWRMQEEPFFEVLMQHTSENASGWLLLLDSTTLPAVRDCVFAHKDEECLSQQDLDDVNLNAEPEDILGQFAQQFGVGNNVNLPVALVLSKADMLVHYKEDLSQDSEIDPSASFLKESVGKRKAVDVDNLWRCDQDLRKFLHDVGQDAAIKTAKSFCPIHAWFATSATGSVVRNNVLQREAPGLRVVEPLEWLLWMVGAYGGMQTPGIPAWTDIGNKG